MSKQPVKIYVGGRVSAEKNKKIQNLIFRRVTAANLPQSGPLKSVGSYPPRSTAIDVANELIKMKVPFDMWVMGHGTEEGTTPDQKLVFRPNRSQVAFAAYCDASGDPIGPKDDADVDRIATLWGDLPDYVASPLKYDDSNLTYEEMHDRLRTHESVEKYYGHEDPRAKDSRFRSNLYRVLGVESHPKREKLFDIAWDEGHSEGLYSVLGYADTLSELLL